MPIARFAVRVFSVSLLLLGASATSGQDYPSRAIRIITSGVGGGNDFVARLAAQGISGPLGQAVIVENRGGGAASGEIVAKAPPDGYTLLAIGSSHWLGQFLLEKMPYDAVKDFLPVTVTAIAPYVLVVHPSLPVKSVKELIALAKARPGELNYGAGSIGSPGHLAGELFKAMANLKIVRVNYKGGGPALNSLLGGEVQFSFSTIDGIPPQVNARRLRALAVTGAQPSTLMPGLPTMVASGLPDFEVVTMQGLFAPAKTPAAVINRLNQEVVRFLKTPEAKERYLAGGFETIGSTPEQLAAAVNADIVRFGKLIKDAGIRMQ